MGTSMQEVFDKVVAHLRSMPEQSKQDNSNKCMYRGPKGLKCAVGALISDNHYDPFMESAAPKYGRNGSKADQVLEAFYRSVNPSTEITIMDWSDFLVALQTIHDNSSNWGSEGFVNEDVLETLADNWNLAYTPK